MVMVFHKGMAKKRDLPKYNILRIKRLAHHIQGRDMENRALPQTFTNPPI